MNITVSFVLIAALTIASWQLMRERRLRLAFQSLLTRLLKHWRPYETNEDGGDGGRRRNDDARRLRD
jgi:hypothetical protein